MLRSLVIHACLLLAVACGDGEPSLFVSDAGAADASPEPTDANSDAGLDATLGDAAPDADTPGDPADSGPDAPDAEPPRGPLTLLLVLEGLRPELLSAERTPNLWRFAEGGVRFTAHRSVIPGNSMAAAASLATGRHPGEHGVLGERLYLPNRSVRDAAGHGLDTRQPVHVNDQGTLDSLRADPAARFLDGTTVIQAAQRAGLQTAVVGRVGPSSLFDPDRQGWLLNDHHVWPRAFAELIHPLGAGLPTYATTLFPDLPPQAAVFVPRGETQLLGDLARVGTDLQLANWKPSQNAQLWYLDPTQRARESAFHAALQLEGQVVTQLAREQRLDLLVYWLREPGDTLVRQGPGSPSARRVLSRVDQLFGEILDALPPDSNVLVTSDGGVTALAGDPHVFPRWALARPNDASPNAWAQLAVPGGLPVDGAVRLVDLLQRAGFDAFDGESCVSGHAYSVYPRYLNADEGLPLHCISTSLNPKGGEQTGPALVPEPLGARGVVVASNRGSELIHVPSHDLGLVRQLVSFLHTRPEVGAVFVSPRYADSSGTLAIPGALDLASLGFTADTAPDVLVTYAWDADDIVAYGPAIDAPRALTSSRTLGETGCRSRDCRSGLYCERESDRCLFCPADRDPTDPDCGAPERVLDAARAASHYVAHGGYCERTSVCADGLECRFGLCRHPGEDPAPLVTAPADGALRGSSYGAMTGVVVEPVFGSGRLLRDEHGVRGGSSPAELSAVLLAAGPAFQRGVTLTTPSGLIDVAPTLLHVLQPGLETQLSASGRLLTEALADATPDGAPHVTEARHTVSRSAIPLASPLHPSSTELTQLTPNSTYQAELLLDVVEHQGREYHYPRHAGATRTGLLCDGPSDCTSHVCGAQGACLLPSCSDGVRNGTERDIDCGPDTDCGACLGEPCATSTECASGLCGPEDTCVPLHCGDATHNEAETDVDCGGPTSCPRCEADQHCLSPSDCASGECNDISRCN